MVGLGHGGTEALIFGVLAAVGFATMLAYRSIDLSMVPSISAEQLELARQQVAAYWSAPMYMAILGFVERIFAMCLHVSLSVMVLYALVYMNGWCCSGTRWWMWWPCMLDKRLESCKWRVSLLFLP